MSSAAEAAAYYACKRRRVRQDVSAFKALHASPANLGSAAAGGALTPLKLPANARLAIVASMTTVQNDITAVIGTHNIGTIGGPAGTEFRLGWHERSESVTIHRAAGAGAGTISLYVLDNYSRRVLIATGTFT